MLWRATLERGCDEVSDQVTVARGAHPWLPTPDTRPVETLGYYDSPLLGIFRQHDVPYLFRCLAGQFSSAQIWLYVPLTEPEVAALQHADGASLDELVDALSVDRQVTVALADETAGLLYSELQDTSGLVPDGLPSTVVMRLQGSLKRINERTEDLVKNI